MSSTALQYTQNGDYLVPNIELNQPQPPLGKYGQDAPDSYLKENQPRPLQPPAPERDAVPAPGGDRPGGEAAARTDDARVLTQAAGATEELKARDPMQWTGRMNACKAQAEEVIRNELIFN